MSSPFVPAATLNPAAVWRDAVGPGFAVGVVDSLARIAAAAARRPYKASLSDRC